MERAIRRKNCGTAQKAGLFMRLDKGSFHNGRKMLKSGESGFVKLYNKGLIYRGNRIINWCPSCRTALSDAEVEYEQKDSYLWHIRYPFEDGQGELIIATTRPETMLGDTAVAVNPNDKKI